MIYLGSRYEDSPITPVLAANKDHATLCVMRPSEPIVGNTQRFYYWRYGDRMDILAMRTYGDPRQWWRIVDANREIIDPLSIEPGTKIQLP